MEASLHGKDVDTAQFTEDEFATVAFHCRNWEIWNFRIWYLLFVCYF
jgi:hypothetical protein